jgi:hypothetical protein
MTRFHAIRSVALLTLVGLSTGIAVDYARSQDLSVRNDLITDPHQPVIAAVEPQTQSSTLPAAANLPVGNVWPPQADGRPNPLWAIPIATLTATRDRPIFSPSRRAPPSAVVPVPQVQQPLIINGSDRPPLILVGTVAGTTDGIAIFQNEGSKDIVRLRTGESHAGWTLTAVKPREVTLLHDRKTAILDIPSPPAKAN